MNVMGEFPHEEHFATFRSLRAWWTPSVRSMSEGFSAETRGDRTEKSEAKRVAAPVSGSVSPNDSPGDHSCWL